MIRIELIGMDHYLLEEYSKEITPQLAKMLGVSSDDFFYQATGKLYHGGVDQTSWNCMAVIHLDKKFIDKEKAVADYILQTMTEYILNGYVQFVYETRPVYRKINEEYPPFLDKRPEEEINEDEEEYEEVDEEDIYTGDVFAGFEEKLQKRKQEENKGKKEGD